MGGQVAQVGRQYGSRKRQEKGAAVGEREGPVRRAWEKTAAMPSDYFGL